jgi:hypothetical protein
MLWNRNVHYHVYNSPQLVPPSGEINPVHALPHHFVKIHLNIILPPTAKFKSSPFPSDLPTKILLCSSPLPHMCYMFRPSHTWFNHSLIFSEEQKSWRRCLCSSLQSPVTSSHLLPTKLSTCLRVICFGSLLRWSDILCVCVFVCV